ASLTLSAYRNITVSAAIASSGGGGVELRADNTGNGTGAVTFDSGGSIATTGDVDILYNPLVYSAPVNYVPYVTAGTMNAYMLVNDVDQLQAMNTNISGHYALGRDIDASETAEWNGGLGFAPVGSSGARFNGSFDGRGHYISGLTIQRPGTR